MPGSVCIPEGSPTAITPAVSLETWMEFYWQVRAFNVYGSGTFTDDNGFSFTDTFNGVQGNSFLPVQMRSFMCIFEEPGLQGTSPNPAIQVGVFGSFEGLTSGSFGAALSPLRGFQNEENYYIRLAFIVVEDIVREVVSTAFQYPAGQITFNLRTGSFVVPLFHGFDIGTASFSLTATPASYNLSD